MNYADAARFMRKVDRSGEHWLWTSSTNGVGYGQMGVTTPKGWRPFYAHRLSYELFVGPIPDGMQIDHLCRIPACVNPAHLEPVTSRENTMRGSSRVAARARQTHCVHGHEFTPENTYRIGPYKTRSCRTCAIARSRARRA